LIYKIIGKNACFLRNSLYICIRKLSGQLTAFFKQKNLYIIMKKEIRQDLYTQSEYAKKIGVSQPRVAQMMKEGKLNTLFVNGAVLIKHT